MASFAVACRLSARLTSRQLRQDAAVRGFRSSAANHVAQNFTMPALSPTMTEGNIASWKVKEGDSFAAGDVILEIETDKASMDVEAQDDGIMAKIFQGDGTKGIQVGERIGVIAEPGDDLSALEIPSEEKSANSPSKDESPIAKSESASKSESESSPAKSSSSSALPPQPKSGPAKKQTYPLLPSVEHLLHENGLDASAVDKMTPSGPNNRLLKGDVLAYLGTIAASYPAELSSKIQKLSHLDLSNIKIVPSTPAPKAAETSASALEPVVEDLEVALPISMKAVLEVQKRIQSTLGITIPLSTFIYRASDLANDNLPRPKSYQPTADELFNQVLGLDKVSSAEGVKGSFFPEITASLGTSAATKPVTSKVDIIDVLAGTSRSSSLGLGSAKKVSGPPPLEANVFSVKVPKGDEKRAQIFLDRVKTVLEGEPGRLVL